MAKKVNKEALERIRASIARERQSCANKLDSNRRAINALAKEQRTLKAQIGLLYENDRTLRDLIKP